MLMIGPVPSSPYMKGSRLKKKNLITYFKIKVILILILIQKCTFIQGGNIATEIAI